MLSLFLLITAVKQFVTNNSKKTTKKMCCVWCVVCVIESTNLMLFFLIASIILIIAPPHVYEYVFNTKQLSKPQCSLYLSYYTQGKKDRFICGSRNKKKNKKIGETNARMSLTLNKHRNYNIKSLLLLRYVIVFANCVRDMDVFDCFFFVFQIPHHTKTYIKERLKKHRQKF